jgi:hypothetical protein
MQSRKTLRGEKKYCGIAIEERAVTRLRHSKQLINHNNDCIDNKGTMFSVQ